MNARAQAPAGHRRPRAKPESRAEAGGLDSPPSTLHGVGPVREAALARLGITCVRDLLLHSPRRAEPYPSRTEIARALDAGAASVVVEGRVVRRAFSRFGRRSLLRIALEDSSGRIDVLFFNQAWLRERFQVGDSIQIQGHVVDARGRALVAERLGDARSPLPESGEWVVEYGAADGLTGDALGALCRAAVERFAGACVDPLPAGWLAQQGLPSLERCVRDLHAPDGFESFAAAARRAGLERALAIEARLAARRGDNRRHRAPRAVVDDRECERIRSSFPFVFTQGQARIADELRADLGRSTPMRRLLQGDVGSGKTALGMFAAALAARGGVQTAFMAPTEILAEQHFHGTGPLCARLGLRSALVTGGVGAAERRELQRRCAEGRLDVVFGTHALFSEGLEFQRLGLAVIDEQHRFGVEQRARLLGKGQDVHLLLMTATPIPRSLAMTVYGDLDASLLTERPPGRARIATTWVRGKANSEALAAIDAALERGERVYWVVPRIGSAEDQLGGEAVGASNDEGQGALERFAKLGRTRFARHGIELVHGRLPAQAREAALDRFRRGEARVLVATTVIEVGIDVAEATQIVIEGADRLGLAQLHQLRGRVGRGGRPSACWLYGKPRAAERLSLLERESDGFAIAEADLRLRGMGDLGGLRQAGAPAAALSAWDDWTAPLSLARGLLVANPRLAEEYLRAPPAAGQ